MSELDHINAVKLMRQRCEIMILSLLGEEISPKWWDSPNKAFELKTPNEVWSTDPESVYKYICGCIDGYW